MIPPVEKRGRELEPAKQLARTPFLVGFGADWFRFQVCTTHILYGEADPENPERVEEIKARSGFLAERAKEKHAWAKNMILLGDFGRQSATAAEQTRRAIIESALRLFAERGFESVSVRDIAERAGSTHGLIRHHFGSKEGVWRAVVDAADAEYVAALQPLTARAATEEDDPAIAVAEIVRGLVLVSARHPEIVRLLVGEGSSGGERLDYILAHVEPLRQAVAPLFARLRRRGSLRQFNEDTFFLFILLAGATPFALSALTTRILGEDILAEKNARQHADRIVRTLFADDRLLVAE